MSGTGYDSGGLAFIASDRERYAKNALEYDTISNARLNAKFGVSEIAALWGKPIPITWGKRRITGQLLQLGLQTQKTVVAERPTFPDMMDLPNFQDQIGSASVTFTPQTLLTSTFAYVFGAPGNPLARQILRKLWFDGRLIYDIDQGSLSPEIVFRFYQGDELQTPDVELNRDRYDWPVGYRGLMYIVFYNYALPDKSPGSGNPLVEAEFAEELANAQPATNYDNFDGEVYNVDFSMSSVAFDAKRNLVYVVGNDQNIYKYEGNTKALLDVYPITGVVMRPPSGYNFTNNIFTGFGLNGVFYLVGIAAASNSRQLFIINADTGSVVNSLGDNTSVTDPNTVGGNPPHLAGIDGASVTVASTSGGTIALLSLTSLFDFTYAVQVSPTGQLSYKGHTAVPGDPNGGLLTVENGQLANYTCVVNDTHVYRNGVVWYTLPHNVTFIIESALDNAIVVFASNDDSNWTIIKLYTKDASVAWEYGNINTPDPRILPPAPGTVAWANNSYTANQRIAWTSNNNSITTLNFLSGQMDVVDAITPVGGTNRIYDAFNNSFIFTSNTGGSHLVQYPILQQSTTNMPLATLLRNLAERQGYETANIVIEGIPDTILGAAITEVSDINTILEDIRVAYNFEIVKRGSRIKFFRRGYGSDFEVDATLGEADLALMSESENEFITVETEIVGVTQAPGSIRVRYIDPAYLYTVNEYVHKRNSDDVDVSVEQTLNLPIIMSTDEAAALAMRSLLQTAMNGVKHNFRLPQKYLGFEPGDTFALQLNGYTDNVRAIEIAYNADWSMSVQSEAIYTDLSPDFLYVETEPPIENPPLLQGEGKPIVIDTTLIRATDQLSGGQLEMYVGAVPAGRLALVGINTLIKSDNGNNAPVQNIPQPLALGSTIGVLSPSSPVMSVNYSEELRFRVIVGDGSEYVSATVLEVLAGANRLLVGKSGRWEQIGFINAAFDSATRAVTLTGLIRGLRGTEPFANTHSGGDYVIRANDPGVVLVADDLGDLGSTVVYAIGDSLGRANANDAAAAYVLGVARRPWAPYNVHAVAAGSDVELTWHRRTRLTGPLLDGTPAVPLDEASEVYELEVYRAGAIVRTVTGLAAPAFTYTAAMQTADGWSSTIVSLRVDVYQVSADVGRGFVKSGTYNVE